MINRVVACPIINELNRYRLEAVQSDGNHAAQKISQPILLVEAQVISDVSKLAGHDAQMAIITQLYP